MPETIQAQMDRGPDRGRENVEPAVIGDPRLHQVKEFLDEPAPPANPLLILVRVLRGRMPLALVLALLLAALFGVAAYLAVSPNYQSQGLIRVAARVPKVMYADPNDPRLRLFDSFVSAEVTYVRSRPVLERTLATLVDEFSDQDRDAMEIGDLGKMISVRKDKGLITVAALAPQP